MHLYHMLVSLAYRLRSAPSSRPSHRIASSRCFYFAMEAAGPTSNSVEISIFSIPRSRGEEARVASAPANQSSRFDEEAIKRLLHACIHSTNGSSSPSVSQYRTERGEIKRSRNSWNSDACIELLLPLSLATF
jgi:CRP-like cAMP-binding protein